MAILDRSKSEVSSPIKTVSSHLNPPHGGELIELMGSPERKAELRAKSRDWSSWDLTPRQLCDLELLLNGGFSPLRVCGRFARISSRA